MKPVFRVIGHIADFNTSGYYLVCMGSGLSIDRRYDNPDKAVLDGENLELRLCKCRSCTDYYFEQDVLLNK